MGDSFGSAASLEAIAQRREQIELRRLALEERHLAREEQRLLALNDAQTVIRESVHEPVNLIRGSSPPPGSKQEMKEPKRQVRDNADDQHQAIQTTLELDNSDYSRPTPAHKSLEALTRAPNSLLASSSSLPRMNPVQAARNPETEGSDPVAARNRINGGSRPSILARPSMIDLLDRSKSSSAETTTSRPMPSKQSSVERRTKKNKKRASDHSAWNLTDDPNYSTIVKAATGIPGEFVELKCYLCHGNSRGGRYLRGPLGFIQHLKICHPEHHPGGLKLSEQQAVELCGQPLSKAAVDGILEKRADNPKVPRIAVAKAPSSSRIHATIAAKKQSHPSNDNENDYKEDGEGEDDEEEEEEEDDEVNTSGEMSPWRAASTRRSGPQLVWTKKMGTHPITESDRAADSDEE